MENQENTSLPLGGGVLGSLGAVKIEHSISKQSIDDLLMAGVLFLAAMGLTKILLILLEKGLTK